MIRIIGSRLLQRPSGPGPVLDLNPFDVNHCSTALSNFQHEAKIPNCSAAEVADFPNSRLGSARRILIFLRFLFWHGSCSVVSTTICQLELAMEAQENQVALPLRSHTILGVCEAVGEDFGFNPVLLRIPFAASVIYSPMMAIAVYFALGAFVLGSRLLFPKANAVTVETAQQVEPVAANEQRELAKAA